MVCRKEFIPCDEELTLMKTAMCLPAMRTFGKSKKTEAWTKVEMKDEYSKANHKTDITTGKN